MDPLLKVTNLKKSFRLASNFKKVEVLKGLNFELRSGRVTGFLGSNGAGKTTTIKSLLGFIYPDEGEINFFGKGYNNREVKARIGFLPERPYFYDHLSGYEFLKFSAQLSGVSKGQPLDKKIDELLEKVELTQAKHKRLREYSKGMLQRAGIAQALIHQPEFVILDEPMSGLDPDGRFKINQILKDIATSGTSVFFSSHLLYDAESLCQDLLILVKGQVVYQGEMEKLLNQLKVGHTIIYRRDQIIDQVSVESESELQKKIDQLRIEQCSIVEIKTDRPSLEKAFVQISSEYSMVNK